MNKVCLTGLIASMPVTIPGGLLMTMDIMQDDVNPEAVKEEELIRVHLWRGVGETIIDNHSIGEKVYTEGRLSYRNNELIYAVHKLAIISQQTENKSVV